MTVSMYSYVIIRHREGSYGCLGYSTGLKRGKDCERGGDVGQRNQAETGREERAASVMARSVPDLMHGLAEMDKVYQVQTNVSL